MRSQDVASFLNLFLKSFVTVGLEYVIVFGELFYGFWGKINFELQGSSYMEKAGLTV